MSTTSTQRAADGNLAFFRPGQLVLIHRSTVTPDYPLALSRVIAHLDAKLNLKFSAAGESTTLRRGKNLDQTLQMKPIYMAGFEPNSEPIRHTPEGSAMIRAGVEGVARAFEELNGQTGNTLLREAGFIDPVISPNWFAMPLQPVI